MTDTEFIVSLNDQQLLHLWSRLDSWVSRELEEVPASMFEILDCCDLLNTARGLEVEE